MSQIMPPEIANLRSQPPQSDIHPPPNPAGQGQPQQQPPQQPQRDPNLDPKLSEDMQAGGQGAGGQVQNNLNQVPGGLQMGGALDSNQIINLLRHLPGLMQKTTNEQGQTTVEQLQHLAAARALPPGPSNFQFATAPPAPGHEMHPPPHLAALAHQHALTAQAQSTSGAPPGQGQPQPVYRLMTDSTIVQPQNGGTQAPNTGASTGGTASKAGAKRKRGRGEDEDEEDWTRQRKDNHKEVERRRRGNINEGINELARIVPNGTGEKAKTQGAILARAVQYIHRLKENEARNIEKWTLEKLLMDQAMGDLQAQLEEMRRLWEEERAARERAQIELDVIRAGGRVPPASNANPPNSSSTQSAPGEREYHPSDRHHQSTSQSQAQGQEGSRSGSADGAAVEEALAPNTGDGGETEGEGNDRNNGQEDAPSAGRGRRRG